MNFAGRFSHCAGSVNMGGIKNKQLPSRNWETFEKQQRQNENKQTKVARKEISDEIHFR